CTQTDSCQAGACVGSNPVTCASTNPCVTGGSCDPSTGLCGAGQTPVADGTPCSDGNACTGVAGVDSCQAGVCVAGAVKDCPSSNPCMTGGTCEPGTGACIGQVARANGTNCDDGNA